MPHTITPEKARDLAYSWHGGQYSPLYAFASSGLVEDEPALRREVQDCLGFAFAAMHTQKDYDELRQLLTFIRLRLTYVKGDRYPWRAPWAS